MRQSKQSDTEYVYLLQEREFVRLEEPTYKIGRTKNPDNRHKAYPKDSELLMLCKVPDCKAAEQEIKAKFSEQFKQRREYGVEYFNGDAEKMMSLMSSIVYPIERPFGNLFRRKPLPTKPTVAPLDGNKITVKPLPLPLDGKKIIIKPLQAIKSLLAPKKLLPLPPAQELTFDKPITAPTVIPLAQKKASPPKKTVKAKAEDVIEERKSRRTPYREKKHVCSKCGNAYTARQGLDKHIRKHHKKCLKCGYVACTEKDFEEHREICETENKIEELTKTVQYLLERIK